MHSDMLHGWLMLWTDDLWLTGLFLSAFVAATLLPGASEVVLVGGLLGGKNALAAVAVATLGNMLGALTTFFLGKFLGNKAGGWVGVTEKRRQRSQAWIARYGSWLLLFSWVPVLGDPLVFAAGFVRLNFFCFLVFTLLGKLARYTLVAWLTLGSVQLLV